jgi:hypothetical protein
MLALALLIAAAVTVVACLDSAAASAALRADEAHDSLFLKCEGYWVGFANTRINVWTYCHKSIYPEAQKGMLALNHTFVPLKLDFAEEKGDRGRNETLVCLAPPSEPDLRISRIRLSS